MPDENKNPFAEEKEIDLEEGVAEEEFDGGLEGGLEEGVGEEAGEELVAEFDSPVDALGAALDEHGADPQALMEWFQEYGYDLVPTGELGVEEEDEGPMDLAGLRTSVVEKLGPMLGGEK